MLLGIVTDIHDEVDHLRQALAGFESMGVDQVVSMGDAVETYESGQPGVVVFRLLKDANAIGVWGNHDAGLSLLWTERIRAMIDPSLADFAATLEPYIVMEDCRFSHIEPWLDATKIRDLWYFDGVPDTEEKASRSFGAVPERRLFMGHFHRWLVMTPEGRLEWNGEGPLQLEKETRYLIVVAHLMHGWYATFDTESLVLTPLRCAETPRRPTDILT